MFYTIPKYIKREFREVNRKRRVTNIYSDVLCKLSQCKADVLVEHNIFIMSIINFIYMLPHFTLNNIYHTRLH